MHLQILENVSYNRNQSGNEDFEDHNEKEMDVNEVTGDFFFKDAVFHSNVQIRKLSQICSPICS